LECEVANEIAVPQSKADFAIEAVDRIDALNYVHFKWVDDFDVLVSK